MQKITFILNGEEVSLEILSFTTTLLDWLREEKKLTGKSKLKLNNPVDKRDFKLTVSRALNVMVIEVKQRSLAAVKRVR